MDSPAAYLYYLIVTLASLFFLHCNHFPRCTAAVDKHFDGYWSLQLMTRGAVRLSYGDEPIRELRGVWVWACWPGPRIRFGRAPDQAYWVHRYVAFRGPLVGRWQEQGLLPFAPQRPSSAPPGEFVRQFDLLLSLARRDDTWARLRAANLLEGLLLQLAEQRRGRVTPWLEEVERCLARQATQWPEYETVAREMGMGLSTLRRCYREQGGLSLHAQVLQRRIAAARELLGDTALPIKEVARRLGYRDIYFFSRQFRQFAGISPGAFRRSRQD